MALENLYFNTLDREKMQGKSLGCIKSWGDTYATGSHRRWMKEPHVAREPRIADPLSRAIENTVLYSIQTITPLEYPNNSQKQTRVCVRVCSCGSVGRALR